MLLKLSALLLGAIGIGCNALPAGDIHSIQPLHSASTSAAGASSSVVLIRGWRDLWSDGIDQLAERIRQERLPAVVFKESQWREVAEAIGEEARHKKLNRPIVLIGFSYGADDVIQIARQLNKLGEPVDRLILIDPVTPADIPPNVRRCVNYYQSNGAWDVFPWLRGVPVKAEARDRSPPVQPAVVVNVNLREHPDLLEPTTSHKTIAGNAKVHAAILQDLRVLTAELASKRASH